MRSDIEFLNYCETEAKNNAVEKEVQGQKYTVITMKGKSLNRLYKTAEVKAPKVFEAEAEVEVEASMVTGLVNQAWKTMKETEGRWVGPTHVYNQGPGGSMPVHSPAKVINPKT